MMRKELLLAACVAAASPVTSGSAQTTGTMSASAERESTTIDTARVLARHVTITLDRATLRRAIDAVAKAAGVQVGYRPEIVNVFGNKTVTLSVSETPLHAVMSRVLAGTTLQLRVVSNDHLAVVDRAGNAPAADSGAVRGVVNDSATGKGVDAATVTVQGTRISATTRTGNFVLTQVPAGDQTLVIRQLGYRNVTRTVHVTANESATIHVVLAPLATVLSGVVTTATGTQRRAEIGSDITSINVEEVMKTAPITSVTDLLEARVPGLTVMHTSGTPGDPSRLRLRGAASIQGNNNPIVIVDGVRMYYSDDDKNGAGARLPGAGQAFPRPSPLDQIDPNAIETIDVFKGPSASSLYGSDAANGVIVITTKRGRAGATHWSFTGNSGVGYIPGSYPTLTYSFGHPLAGGASDYLECFRGGWSDVGACGIDSTITFQALNDPRYSPLTHGISSGASATVSGGVESLQYSLTGSMTDEGGMVRLPRAIHEQYLKFTSHGPPSWMTHPDDYRTWGAVGQLTAMVSPTLHVTFNNRLANSDQRRSSLGLSGVSELIGRFIDTTRLGQTALMTGFSQKATANTASSTNAITADWDARSWLHMNATAGLDQNHATDVTYRPSGLPIQLLQTDSDTSGAYSISHANGIVKTGTVGATFALPLPTGKRLRLAVGFNAQNTTTGSDFLSTTSVPVGVSEPQLFLPAYTTAAQTTNATTTYGWYVEPQFELSGRFFFSPGIRFDGGSASGSNAGLTHFPKMQASWIALDQDDAGRGGWRSVLTQLRLRGAYGYAGVQPDPQDRLRLVNQLSVVLDGTTQTPGVIIYSQGNTGLRPERSAELETGFDADLFDSRLTLTATYYHKKRLDAIMTTFVGSSAGGGTGTGVLGSSPYIATVKQNIGNVRNTGLEISTTAQIIQRPAFQWSVNFSAASNNNKLLTLNEGLNSSPGGYDARLVVGYPIDGVWARSLAGYNDINGDGSIEPSEITMSDSLSYLGTQNPKYTSAFGSTVALLNGRLTGTVLFDYQNGLTQYNALASSSLAAVASAPGSTLEQQAVFVATRYASLWGGGLPITPRYNYQTVNTFRLNSASLSYTLPVSIARALHGQSVSVSMQGSNLWLHTNYTGKDPNVNAETHGEGVSDFGQIPQPRTWVFRVNITN